jgi:hypothetical protein
MKRTDSFIHDYKIVKIELTTNVDDDLIKSFTQSFFMDYFSTRKRCMTEDDVSVLPEKSENNIKV